MQEPKDGLKSTLREHVSCCVSSPDQREQWETQVPCFHCFQTQEKSMLSTF